MGEKNVLFILKEILSISVLNVIEIFGILYWNLVFSVFFRFDFLFLVFFFLFVILGLSVLKFVLVMCISISAFFFSVLSWFSFRRSLCVPFIRLVILFMRNACFY